MKIPGILFTALLFVTVLFAVNQAGASIVEFSMDFEYSGGNEPAGAKPWATATFADNELNNVTLTMSTANLVGAEFISVWLFNLDPNLNPDLLEFSSVGIPGSVPDSINTGSNAFEAGPDKFYDIEFNFPQPQVNQPDKFTPGETVVYNLTYAGNNTIDAYSFNFQSESDKDDNHYYSAANVQIDGVLNVSGWIGGTPTVVPEPVSSTLFIVGGSLFGFRQLRKRRKTLLKN